MRAITSRTSTSSNARKRRNRVLVTAAGCAAALLSAPAAYGDSASWTNTGGDAVWTNDQNWSPNTIPGVGDTATFNDPAVTGDQTVYTNGNKTISTMIFDSPGVTAIFGGTSAVGATQRITFSGGVSNGITVNAGAGAVVIGQTGNAITTQLDADATFTTNSSNVLTLSTTTTSGGTGARVLTLDGSGTATSGGISGVAAAPISIVKNGSGSWQFGSNSHTGGMTINAGTVLLASSNSLGSAVQTVTFNGGTVGAVGGSNRTIPANVSISITNATGTPTFGGVLSGRDIIVLGSATINGDFRTANNNLTLSGPIDLRASKNGRSHGWASSA